MDDTRKDKINRFMSDKVLSEAVYKVLLDSFLADNGNTVQELAAERLAINCLRQGWKELAKFKREEPKERTELRQVGV